MKTMLSLIVCLILTISACTPQPTPVVVEESPTPTLPDPQVYITPAPDVESAIERYLQAWLAEDYPAMYRFLSAEAQRSIPEDDFSERYLNTAIALSLKFEEALDYQILNSVTNPDSAVSLVAVNFNTNLFGTLTRQIEFPLVREGGDWRLQWDDGVIMPELQGGNKLEVVRQTTSRGAIYAREGSPIAAQEDAVAIGYTPALLDQDLMSLFYTTMARLTVYQVDEIIEMTESALPNDYIPLGEVTQAAIDKNMSSLSLLSGVYLNYYTSRFYYDGGIAPQAVGHLTYISPEELNTYLRLGYAPNERFGSTGLESVFEDVLAGQRGAALYLKDPNGQVISKLAERPVSPGQSLTTTIDPRLQYLLQQSLGNFRGAIVAMEVDTGRIVAMVSNPQFDPNLFDINNQNFVYANNPYAAANDPVFNRATNGQYPLGSVFKVITMAAALDTGVFTKDSEIYCGHSIEVCGNELFDWTYEKERPPSGDLTLPEGLMRSCNPWFYYIGEQLVFEGYPDAIAQMSRSFGLGKETGIEISEQPGNIPEQTHTCELNTQLAIGQGEMTGTPLQVASFMAAIGNGGTLYRPALVETIGSETGTPSYTFEPEVTGSLPISEEHLTLIQDSMREVIKNPRGTAQLQLATMRYRAYGKTGTAQNPFGKPHAWFAGYTDVNDENRPDIAIAVLIENIGDGSEFAAPVFRRVISLYFSDYADSGYTLPWEAYPYVVASPTPIPSDTPIPTNTPIPTETPIGGEEPTEEPEE